MAASASPRILDVRGLSCPLPVLRARQASRELAPGGSLTVLATDPASAIDFPVFCHHAGLELVSTERNGDLLTFEIRKPPSVDALHRLPAADGTG
ncbi:MAG: hypothetical protein GC191_06985 [Azospirillum sp.]|nr:hypothetical protein [Azospirillum sp.]